MSDQTQSRRHSGRLAPLAGAVLLALGSAVHAATITVTHAGDAHVTGGCSLREAARAATNRITPAGTNCAAGSGNDRIRIPFPAITLSQGSLELTSNNGEIVIEGTLADRTLIRRDDAAASFRLIDTSVYRLTLVNLHLDNGLVQGAACGGALLATRRFPDNGVAIYTDLVDSLVTGSTATTGGGICTGHGHEVSLTRSTVAGNTASSHGGGIFSSGAGSRLTLVESTVEGNLAGGSGGGLRVDGSLAISHSTISGNMASTSGGGISATVGNKYSATINNSTISANTTQNAEGTGGGIWLFGRMTIRNSTLHGNATMASGSGGGIYLLSTDEYPTQLTLTSSLLVGNQVGKYNENIGSSNQVTVSGSHNLIRASAATVTLPGDTRTCPASLRPLADNGGPTLTQALRMTPVAASNCAFDTGLAGTASFDQRGDGHPRIVGVAADIGAFEYSDVIFADGFQ